MNQPIISVTNLSKHYVAPQKGEGVSGSLKSLLHRERVTIEAVKDVSFTIQPGELVGFLGPNGAGKTTTLKMLSGLLHPSSGSVEVLGYTPHQRKESYLKQISFVMGQKNQLWWDLPVIESFNLNRDIYGVPAAQYRETLAELVELLGLQDILNQQVRRLSLGQRMKCELAAALIHRPKVLFLDEPTLGLDVVAQQKIREFIKEYNRRWQAAIMLTSHYMDDVKELCERVIVIDEGRVLFDGQLDQLTQRYATYKTLSLTLGSKAAAKHLKRYGQVVEHAFPKAVLRVPADKTANIAAKLLATFDVTDVTISEPSLEDVVRQLFTK